MVFLKSFEVDQVFLILRKHLGLIILLILLIAVQTQLWFGRGSLPNVEHLREQVQALQDQNQTMQAKNLSLSAEVEDLKTGLGMIEDRARYELGMLKPNEVFVQVQ